MKQRPVSLVVALAALAVVATGGSAYAYWTAYGSGTSTATVAKVKPLVIDPVDIKDMVIGSPASLKGEVRNPNNFDASLTGVNLMVAIEVDQHHQGCNASNFKHAPPTTTAKSIKANAAASFGGGTITLIETGVDQAACQGATLTLHYELK